MLDLENRITEIKVVAANIRIARARRSSDEIILLQESLSNILVKWDDSDILYAYLLTDRSNSEPEVVALQLEINRRCLEI